MLAPSQRRSFLCRVVYPKEGLLTKVQMAQINLLGGPVLGPTLNDFSFLEEKSPAKVTDGERIEGSLIHNCGVESCNMCIAVFLWKSHPIYPFLLLLNRDEYHNRPTTALGWWEDGEILGGRDEQAGGTWLACRRNGKLAFLTNVREFPSQSSAKTRGDLPLRFLKSVKSPREFAEELAGEADHFNGFNLIVADLSSMTMFYITNRPKHDGLSITEVTPGIHVLSNAQLDTPWPKAQRLRCSFEDVLKNSCEAEISLKDLTQMLMNDTTKDDDSSQLPHIYPAEFEYFLSAIFVEGNTSSGRYGTRSTSGVALNTTGEISFYERYLEKDAWKEQTISYHIETGLPS